MTWEDLLQSFVLARRRNPPVDTASYVAQARQLLASNTSEEWNLLVAALQDDDRKWLLANVFSTAPLPKQMFGPFLRAAICELNPSLNRYFVEPCIKSFGHRKVNEVLLDVLENGTNFEIAGAVAALYWANMSISFSGNVPEYTLDYATPKSRLAYLELQDVWERKRSLYLQVFVRNEDLQVRRQIIPSLTLNESAYPDHLKLLVAQAIDIARNHPDEYIRHRVEVQLGNEKLLKPIPERKAGT